MTLADDLRYLGDEPFVMVSTPFGIIQGPAGVAGPAGPPGVQGTPGAGLTLAGTVPTVPDLPGTLGPTDAGTAYIVAGPPTELAVWDGTAWQTGPLTIETLPPHTAANARQVLAVDATGAAVWVTPTAAATAHWLTGTGAPNPATGTDGDHYLDTASQTIYVRADGAWHQIDTPPTPAGTQPTIHHGTVDPQPADGADGDLWLNTTSHALFVKLPAPTGWTNEGALGAAGAPAGTPPTWRVVTTAPQAADGVDGDWAQLGAGGTHVYVKVRGAWHTVVPELIDTQWVRQTNRDPAPADIGGTVVPGKTLWVNRNTGRAFVAQTTTWLELGTLVPPYTAAEAGKVPAVNAQGTDLEWVTPAAGGPAAPPAYNPTQPYPQVAKVTSGGLTYVATGPVAAGPAAAPPAAPWKVLPDMPPLGTAGQHLVVNAGATATEWADEPTELPPTTGHRAGDSLHIVDPAAGTMEWRLPLPIVVKATQPAAADYETAQIPANAVWIKVAP